MKPKNLKFPFRWEERTPVLSEGVLYVPKHYSDSDHMAWPKCELEKNINSFATVSIEYCSGNGVWIAEKAKENPTTLWIAVEKRFDRVRKIWSKKQNSSLENLLIVCGDAVPFTKYYLSDQVVDRIFVNFPDPWPKDRHAKNRLFQRHFIEEMRRVVKSGGEATLVTDDEAYSHQMIKEMTEENLWSSCLPFPFYVTDWLNYGASFFKDLWNEQGRHIRYMKFKR